MFELLFKYPADMYARGDLVLAGPWWLYLVLVVTVAVAIPTLLFYGRVRGKTRTRDGIVLGLTRTSALALVILALFQPALLVATAQPHGNVVGVLLDDSLSMRIADQSGERRSAFVQKAFAPEAGEVTQALSRRFVLRFFRFASDAQAMQAVDSLAFSGRRTDLARALEQVRGELGDAATAALVVVSDGAVTEAASLDEALSSFRAAGIPIYTVGVGQTSFAKDIEITTVSVPNEVLKGSSIAADVLITHRGFGDKRVKLLIEDDGQLVAREEVTLLADQPAQTFRTQFIANQAGTRLLKFHISPAADEIVRENNARDLVVSVSDRRKRVLHFEGEPRFEVKFVRRALAKDDPIDVVSLIRTAESKFYRLGVEGPEELANGFPQRPEELFAYHALILGSVEASYFTADQLQMIADFVSRRGGGLLVLGGRRGFAAGGYFGTPVAELLPVRLGPKPERAFEAEVSVRPTQVGRTHALTQPVRQASEGNGWETLPPLRVLHPLYGVKPGASTLLEGLAPELPAPLAILAQQRFGRGQALVLNVQNSWRWQMHQDIPLDDQTHETLWRQLLRWLVQPVPDPVTIQMGTKEVSPEESVEVTAEVLDASYLPRNNAEVRLLVTTPVGDQLRLPMDWIPARDGVYQARFTPKYSGLYDLRVEAQSENGLETAETQIQIGAATREYFQAEMREALLQRIAADTGGRFYNASDASRLIDEISTAQADATIIERLELWNMPAGFLLLLTLIGSEWIYRRWRGLV